MVAGASALAAGAFLLADWRWPALAAILLGRKGDSGDDVLARASVAARNGGTRSSDGDGAVQRASTTAVSAEDGSR